MILTFIRTHRINMADDVAIMVDQVASVVCDNTGRVLCVSLEYIIGSVSSHIQRNANKRTALEESIEDDRRRRLGGRRVAEQGLYSGCKS